MSSGHSIGRSGKRPASRSIAARAASAAVPVVMPWASAAGSTLRKLPSSSARPLASGSIRPATSVALIDARPRPATRASWNRPRGFPPGTRLHGPLGRASFLKMEALLDRDVELGELGRLLAAAPGAARWSSTPHGGWHASCSTRCAPAPTGTG